MKCMYVQAVGFIQNFRCATDVCVGNRSKEMKGAEHSSNLGDLLDDVMYGSYLLCQ